MHFEKSGSAEKICPGFFGLLFRVLLGFVKQGQCCCGNLFYLAAENQRFFLVSHPDLPWYGVIRALNSPVLCYMVKGEKEPQALSQLGKVKTRGTGFASANV